MIESRINSRLYFKALKAMFRPRPSSFRNDFDREDENMDSKRTERNPRLMRLFAGSAFILIFFGSIPRVLGQYIGGPSFYTEDALNNWHYFLEAYKSEKGRYPKSLEEVKSFRTDVKSKSVCVLGMPPCQSQMLYFDGWKTPFQYTSNGKTYRMTGSHGFFLTDQTQSRGKLHWYWENTGTPPLDPPPPPDT
jgi:hypothetical protein